MLRLLPILLLLGCSTPPEGDPRAARLSEAQAALLADPAAAEALFAALSEEDPADGVALRGHARAHLELGRLDQATRLATRAITLAKAANDVLGEQEARTLLGEAQIRAGKVEVARDQFDEGVLRSDDGSTWGCAYQGLGELYARLNTAEVALPDPADVAATTPADAFERALAAWRSGSLQEGLAWVARAESVGVEGRVLAAMLKLQSKDVAGAKALLAEDGPGVGWGRAHVAIAERDFEAAEALLQPGTEAGEQHLGFQGELALLGRGWIAANRNDHAAAVTTFNTLVHLQPDSLLARLGLGNSQLGLGDLDAAEATFGQVLARSPGNPYALAELAVIRLARGDVDGAERGFAEVAKHAGDDYTCPYEGLGLAYLKQGRTADAQAAFEKAIEINPDIEYKKFNGLARIHLDAGRLDLAEGLLKRSLANFPQDNPATAMLQELATMREQAPR